ncbi:MAG: efflux RND transporter periplasmic adaptor subunit, partial [Deltaproteobacteria bacterium]|nr:efflux RND transporter periplasmic adaptor subunit [Deltaproteobacteria bacterium]
MRFTRLRFVVFILAMWLALAAGVGCQESTQESHERVEVADQEGLWSCGMHSHVVEHGPGPCPICGMDMTRVRSSPAKQNAEGERRIKYWVAPMDPTYISDEPGKSPMGMDLVPVYEEGQAVGAPGTVQIDPVVIQNMGVRTERSLRQPLFRHVRTLGEVVVSEDRVSVVNLRFSGWVERILADKTGEPVTEGDPLFAIYSPDLVAAQEEYLLALRMQGAKSELARSARRKLELFDLDSKDVAALARTGRVERAMLIRAPRSGHILEKNVVAGARVSAGEDLYTIADHSQIWVQAEVYEFDAPWVEVGQPAHMELAYERGRSVAGSVAYVYPTLNDVSRTLTVRLEFKNPDLRLKPGMFATVYIQFRREDDALVVPTEAILHSGKRELVFVAVGGGRFEPREITTGLVGDRHMAQVLSGLVEGEVVVTSGQFLIDSESQLQEAIDKMLARRAGEVPSVPS